jgi:4-hydroxy-3-polyprenylbenzoate decarboxylase
VPPESRGESTAVKASAILIDATRKWNYPPTSLPERAYMEKAQSLWRELELPPLQLKSPWFGYNLGSWSEEDAADAARAVRGEHYRTGELREQQRVRLEKPEKK